MDYTQLIKNLSNRNFEGVFVPDKHTALEKIKELIPRGASVMNGSSVTLEEIRYIDYLKSGEHGWNDLQAVIAAEPDTAKRKLLRKQAILADYYLGSVHALVETGEMIIASNTGSQLSHLVFSSENIILVVGQQKIVPTMEAAWKRLEEVVIPKEQVHMMEKFGVGTQNSKTLVWHKENPMLGRNVRVIIVEEDLGF